MPASSVTAGLTATVLLLAATGSSRAQAPVAPGSGFGGVGAPTFSGGAPIAPGSGFAPSTAGTVNAGPRTSPGPTPPSSARVYGGDPQDDVRTLPSRRSYGTARGIKPRPRYPGVPDIMEPAD